jgi:5-methylcytosine-specific restriction endonuclease McrA
MQTKEEILEALRKAREKKPPKVKKPIKKISDKKRAAMNDEIKVAAMDRDFYLDIWHASPHKCQNCGCGLGNVPNNIFFHHLCGKKPHPQWRHRPENIMLLCLTCHSKAETNISFAPEIIRRKEIALIELQKEDNEPV